MKKVFLIFSLLLFLNSFSYAAAETVHGSYALNTDACATCHVTHTAVGAHLLKASETDVCYTCHGYGQTGSHFDVQNGLNKFYTPEQPSIGGGFDYIGTTAVTSKHILGDGNTIPGGGMGIIGGLQCSSCHDPHGSTNPRLLKTTVNGVDLTTQPISMSFTTDGTQQTTGYNGGFISWCSACHTRFETQTGSGHTLDAMNKYRHAVGMTAQIPPTSDFTVATGTPLESNVVSCVTCHKSHGTIAKMNLNNTISLTWTREDGTVAGGSVLLRRNNRGVCFNCHGNSYYNLP